MLGSPSTSTRSSPPNTEFMVLYMNMLCVATRFTTMPSTSTIAATRNQARDNLYFQIFLNQFIVSSA